MEQNFLEQIPQLIEKRYSCRSFQRKEIKSEIFSNLKNFFQLLSPLRSSRLRFIWFDKNEVRRERLFSTGTYGLIKNSRYFIALATNKNDSDRFLDLGFLLEQVVLYATYLQLNSCWIGGVFDRRGFSSFLQLTHEEELPVVIALGYAAEKKSIADRLTRWGAKGDLRKNPAELFFSETGHHQNWENIPPQWQQILLLVRRAPSASNRQPWRIIISGKKWHLFLRRDTIYQKLLPMVDLQMIDIGIALAHLTLVLQNRVIPFKITIESFPPAPADWQYILTVSLETDCQK